MAYYDEIKFETLIGKTMVSVVNEDDEKIVFTQDNGDSFELYHSQDCCESVTVESVSGDLLDLVGTPILLAEEASSEDDPKDVVSSREEAKRKDPNYWDYSSDSQTWTFYKLRTIKGSVDIRWYGSSNGYYSEEVSFRKIAALRGLGVNPSSVLNAKVAA